MPRPRRQFCAGPHRCRVLLLSLTLAGGAFAAAPPDLEQLPEDLNEIRRTFRVPGVALTLVSRDGAVWSGGIGFADLSKREPATPDTLYRFAALSDTLTALAALLAGEQDRLSLDAPLEAVLPEAELVNPWAQSHPVRIAHLLERTAGLVDQPPGAPVVRRCHWPPGLFPAWTRAGPDWVRAALRTSVGEPFPTFLERALLDPLGLQRTRPEMLSAAAQTASAYRADGLTPLAPAQIEAASPTVVSSVREAGVLLQLLLNQGRGPRDALLPPAAIRRLETPRTMLGARRGLEYGMGIGNAQSIYRGFLFHGAEGEAAGHLSRYAYSHRLGQGYVLVVNSRSPAALQRLAARVQDYLIGSATPTQPTVARLEAHSLRRLAGRYETLTGHGGGIDSVASDAPLVVQERAGRLYSRLGTDPEQELLAVSPFLFRRAGEPVATIAFVEHGSDLYVQGPFGSFRRSDAGEAAQR